MVREAVSLSCKFSILKTIKAGLMPRLFIFEEG